MRKDSGLWTFEK